MKNWKGFEDQSRNGNKQKFRTVLQQRDKSQQFLFNIKIQSQSVQFPSAIFSHQDHKSTTLSLSQRLSLISTEIYKHCSCDFRYELKSSDFNYECRKNNIQIYNWKCNHMLWHYSEELRKSQSIFKRYIIEQVLGSNNTETCKKN